MAGHNQEGFELGEEFSLPEHLDTIQKLQALQNDPRAGFLPTTHQEKNQAIELLDYLDNSDYKAGLGNRLQEIFLHQKALLGPVRAKYALMSIAFEYGDYLTSASRQLSDLYLLEAKVSECPNPSPTLAEEIGESHPGMAPLIRYMDLSEVRSKGFLSGVGFDPLHTIEDRNSELEPDKNKNIEDPYTGKHPDPIVLDRIIEKTHSLTIGATRESVKAAIKDQTARRDFWLERMRQTRAHGAAWIIGKRVLTNLELPLR